MAESSWDTGGRARQVLEDLVRDYGARVLSDANLLKNLLSDKLPSAPRETSLLVAAADAGVLGMLQERLGRQIPPEAAVQQVAVAFEERRGYDPVACGWVVSEFSHALGYPLEESTAVTQDAPGASGPEARIGSVTVAPDDAGVGHVTVAPDAEAAVTVLPPEGGEAPLGPWGEAPSEPAGSRRRPRWLVVAAVAVPVVVGLVVLAALVGGSSSKPVTAARRVSNVGAAQLALAALETPFGGADLPPGVSVPTRPSISPSSGPDLVGLVARVVVDVAGPDKSDSIDYFIFDNARDALREYNAPFFEAPTTQTGTFPLHGIGDAVQCVTGHRPATADTAAEAEADCQVLSANVVTVVLTGVTTSPTGNSSLATRLMVAAVRNLTHVADVASRLQTRQGGRGLDPTHLLDALSTKNFDPAQLPSTLTNPQLVAHPDPSPTAGQVRNQVVEMDFDGPDTSDVILFAVYDSASHASATLGQGLIDGAQTGALDASGLGPPGSPAFCLTSSIPAIADTPTQGETACSAAIGNVLVFATSKLTSDTQKGNNDLTGAMARLAVLHVYSVDRALLPAKPGSGT